MKFQTVMAAAIIATAWSVTAQALTLPTGPQAGDQKLSPFYEWSGALPKEPGVMLRTEPMPSQPEFTAAGSMERILYTSTDARWNSGVIAVSGILYLPKGKPPEGGWPVVAWGHGTVGVADVCAPSWTKLAPRDATYLNRWLAQGFAVVATDYQGLGGPGPHPYQFWEAEGRSILDSVRAALASHPGVLEDKVVITGQSQGGGSALGASRIAPTYAPELRIMATISTGVLTAFPDGPHKLKNATPTEKWPARFTMQRIVGGALPDGGPKAEDIVTQEGAALLELGRTSCSTEMRDYEQANKLNQGKVFSMAPAELEAMLLPAKNMDGVKLSSPLFIGTGLADKTVVPERQYAAAVAMCAAGNRLTWKTYAGLGHGGVVNEAFEDELRFVRQAFAGQAPDSNCNELKEPGAPQEATPGIPFNQ